ncbi:MAG: xanthine dehydrogenase family protein molybdopterin-binding subunit [Bryobacterales bacterium]|nr:xanthine dehydrogenase family protein molybdopterin-binding subunit [Bryobacterales bacterium]
MPRETDRIDETAVALDEAIASEPDRYELREPPAYDFAPTRREFIEFTGAGLLITILAPCVEAQRGSPREAGIESRLHISKDGIVTVLSGKVEVGQGSRTQLAMAAAEELCIPLDRVQVTLADTELAPNDGITAGSRTTPSTVPAVRMAAATARELLLTRAAEKWRVDRAAITLRDGVATNGSQRMSYAELASSLKEQPGAQPTATRDWKLLGTSHGRTDARAMVTGSHRYPSDIQRPRMLYGAVLRAPVYHAALVKTDTSAASKIQGVRVVQDGSFVGCVAPTSHAARKAIAAIAATAQWDVKAHPSSSDLAAYLKEHSPKEGTRPREQSRGSVEQALQNSASKHRASYFVPYIQHAPMEPRAAVAEWNDGRLTVWTGTQNPFGVRDQLAQAFKLSADRVRVIVPDTGGGFGGKHTGEVAIEAARLAREASQPVSLRWTRKEEFEWAYFRPAGVFEIEAALDGNGLLSAWDFHNYNAGTAAMESPYRCGNVRTRFVTCDSPLREGSYRGIAATANNFARECFVDELAALAKRDPLEFRLANLDNERLGDVLQAAAKKFRWSERKGKSGIAGGTEKGSYVAACAEVEIVSGQVRVREICMAFECGAIMNPANLRAQVEGSIVQGLGAALTEEIQFEGGKLKNGSFLRYRVPRFRDVPPMEIVLLDRKDLPSAGAGETPIIAVAPAIANAVFAATGQRPRRLPIRVA